MSRQKKRAARMRKGWRCKLPWGGHLTFICHGSISENKGITLRSETSFKKDYFHIGLRWRGYFIGWSSAGFEAAKKRVVESFSRELMGSVLQVRHETKTKLSESQELV